MSTIYHMQTEEVHQLAKLMSITANQLWDSVEQTRSTLYRSYWMGQDSEEFIIELESCCKSLFTLIDQLDQLGVRVNREGDKWESVANKFGT